MKIITFIVPQLIGLVIIYFLYGYLFESFEEVYAWVFFGVLVLLYIGYFVYDLLDLIKRIKAARNFKWS